MLSKAAVAAGLPVPGGVIVIRNVSVALPLAAAGMVHVMTLKLEVTVCVPTSVKVVPFELYDSVWLKIPLACVA
jgi:hypothetical protein